jgi:nitrous oxide reductase accessory protein NosL
MVKKNIITAVVLLMLFIGFAGVYAAAQEVKPGKRDRCPVCGMFVAPYPNWVAQIKFKDGTTAFFDGPKDMFRFYFFMDKYNKQKSSADIAGIYVTEFYTTKLMAAEDLFFVTGSDVMGPMGKELVPIDGEKNAQTFRKDHGGEKVMRLEEVTAEDIP